MREKVFKFIDDHASETVDFLKDIVSINSVNSGLDTEIKEVDVQNYIETALTKMGLAVDKFSADEKGVRPNICAVLKGSGQGKGLVLNGHVDTVLVAEPDRWHTDPFKATEIDGRIFGRGVCDMKGGVTAAIMAVNAIKQCGIEPKGDVILQIVAGEESCEGGTIGTAACVKRGYKAPFAVVCEPTNNELHNTTASLLCFELIIKGKSAHICCRNQVMFPQNKGLASGGTVGVDALEKALPFIEFFYRLEKEWNHRWKQSGVGTGGTPTHDRQGVGAFNINPSFVESGSYIAAVPETIKITYAVWHPAEIGAEAIMKEIRERVAALASTDDWLIANPPNINGPMGQLWPGFVTDEDSEPVRMFKESFKKALGRDCVVSGFRAVCDGTYLDELGVPSIVCGPGGIDDGVHGDNESLKISELMESVKIYASFILDWCL